jgi:hypothetical protein
MRRDYTELNRDGGGAAMQVAEVPGDEELMRTLLGEGRLAEHQRANLLDGDRAP